MKLTVRVFGYLRTLCDRHTSQAFVLELPNKSTARDVLALLGIPETEDVMMVVNNATVSDRDQELENHDEVLVYPFLGGG